MARLPQEATPRAMRSVGYVFPSRRRLVLWGSLGLAAVALTLMVGGYMAGVRRTLSPGDVASHHARIDLKCSQCHEPGHDVVAVRCERCHDPLGSERLTQAGHVLMGTGDRRKAESSAGIACVSCHLEHRGRDADLAAVDDRQCGTCHRFSTMAAHDEFAVVRAGATAGVGLRFNHERHFREPKLQGASCDVCHRPTADRRGFAPMSFEQNCTAACHPIADSDPFDAKDLVPPQALPPAWRSNTSVKLVPLDAAFPEEVAIVGARHRDSWVLYNALALRYSIDPDGEAAERLALRGRIAYLEQLAAARPVHAASGGELAAAESTLAAEIASLDAQLAGSAPDPEALRALLASAQGVARQLQGADQTVARDAERIVQESVNVEAQGPAASDDGSRLARRKDELARLLKTIVDRAPDDAMRQRANALSARLARLGPGTGSEGVDPRALAEQLHSLDVALATLRTIPDPGIQTQLTELEVLRSYGQQALLRGLSPVDFETRKTELLALLDSIERRGEPEIRLRVASLRQRIVQLRPGSVGDTELARSRRQRQNQLARVRLEMELLRSTDDYEAPPAHDAATDPVVISQTLEALRRQLAELEQGPRMTVAENADERSTRKEQLDTILGRCFKCHEYDPSGTRLARVRIAEPVMPRSLFNHAPHTRQTSCDTCHAPARKSTKATDINSPGIENCRACHAPSRARAGCATCHVYHPVSPAKMLMVSR